jgi:hypothetical protein
LTIPFLTTLLLQPSHLRYVCIVSPGNIFLLASYFHGKTLVIAPITSEFIVWASSPTLGLYKWPLFY